MATASGGSDNRSALRYCFCSYASRQCSVCATRYAVYFAALVRAGCVPHSVRILARSVGHSISLTQDGCCSSVYVII